MHAFVPINSYENITFKHYFLALLSIMWIYASYNNNTLCKHNALSKRFTACIKERSNYMNNTHDPLT